MLTLTVNMVYYKKKAAAKHLADPIKRRSSLRVKWVADADRASA
jgi:hypothetical protein